MDLSTPVSLWLGREVRSLPQLESMAVFNRCPHCPRVQTHPPRQLPSCHPKCGSGLPRNHGDCWLQTSADLLLSALKGGEAGPADTLVIAMMIQESRRSWAQREGYRHKLKAEVPGFQPALGYSGCLGAKQRVNAFQQKCLLNALVVGAALGSEHLLSSTVCLTKKSFPIFFLKSITEKVLFH